jgi:ribonucleoside-diphosphate reductase alpha chain
MATQHTSKIKINNVTKKQWKNDFKITEAEQLSCNRDIRFVNSAPKIKGNKQFLTTLERFFIAYQADGCTNPTGLSNGRLSGTIIYTFHFKKERKIKRLESIINELGFYYTKKPGKNNDFNILVRVPNNISLKKDFNEWIDLKSINQEWAVSFIDELRHWDGSFKNDNSARYSTTNKNNADITQIIGIIAGYKTKLRKITRDISRKDLFDVSFVKNSRYTSAENIKPQKQYYNGFVYCLSVPTGLLIVRRAGSVAVCGNSLRRGSAAVYLPINHPEIEEFIDIRRPHGGDTNRRSLNLHHGVVVDDEFMKAVEKNLDFDLKSPYSGKTIEKINARDLWIKLLTARIETGEPYILYIDNVNKSIPDHHKKLNLNVKTSNLCAEITLPTGIDHHNQQRTAVCCLSSLNLEFYDQWKDNQLIIEDIMRFLDNVLQDFINKAPDSMKNAKYSASRERSVGLGVMGFHSFLQSKNVPIESAMSKVWNKKIFQNIKQQADKISEKLAIEKGACPDASECNIMERFSNKLAIAPTASISIIANNSSPGIEPFAANSFTQKTLTGSFNVRNKNLEKLLESKQKNTEDIWSSITINEGSVQHLDFLDEHEKLVFKTAQEIDQRWIIDLASDRQEYICQSQSLNIFLPGNVSKKTLHEIHFRAWQKKVKSLYYCRSTSLQRAAKVSNKSQINEIKIDNNQEECLACQ